MTLPIFLFFVKRYCYRTPISISLQFAGPMAIEVLGTCSARHQHSHRTSKLSGDPNGWPLAFLCDRIFLPPFSWPGSKNYFHVWKFWNCRKSSTDPTPKRTSKTFHQIHLHTFLIMQLCMQREAGQLLAHAMDMIRMHIDYTCKKCRILQPD